MTKFVFHLLGMAVAIGLGIAVMIHGWGLNPVSWGWVIWGSIGSAFIGAIISLGGES